MLLVLKKAKFVIFMLCFGFASLCHSVGLGNLAIYSSVNEPLVAEIQLIGCKGIEPLLLQAAVASVTDFVRAGVKRSLSLDNIVFETISPEGQPIIAIQTQNPVTESSLDLLVELVWPDGKLVKHYIIDLPSVEKISRKPKVSKPIAKPKKTKPQVVKSNTAAKVVLQSHTPLLPNVVPDIEELSSTKIQTENTVLATEYTAPVSAPVAAVKKVAKVNVKQVDHNNVKAVLAQEVIPQVKEVALEIVSELVNIVAPAKPIQAETIVQQDVVRIEQPKIIKANKANFVRNDVIRHIALISFGLILAMVVVFILVKRVLSYRKQPKVFGNSRVIQMKIDLAKKYLAVGDSTSARDLLTEVIAVAKESQKLEAQQLSKSI